MHWVEIDGWGVPQVKTIPSHGAYIDFMINSDPNSKTLLDCFKSKHIQHTISVEWLCVWKSFSQLIGASLMTNETFPVSTPVRRIFVPAHHNLV